MNRNVLLKLALSLLLCLVLLLKIDALEVAKVILSLNHSYFAIALLVVPILYAIRTYRWQIMLESLGFNIDFLKLLKIIIIGVFYGLATPGKVGEFARILHIKGEKSELASTIMLEKIYDISILLILSIITITFYFRNQEQLKYVVLNMAVLIPVFFLMLMNSRFIRYISNILRLDLKYIDNYLEALNKIFKDRNLMFRVFSASFLYYIFVYIMSFFILCSLGIDYKAVLIVPLIVLMGNIPITIAGIGLRESIGTICFVGLGESAVHGLSFSVIIFIAITVIPSLFGYLLSISSIDTTKTESCSNNKN